MASTSANQQLGAFFDHLVRCETRLYNAVGERLRTEHGIVTSQFEYLRYLRDHPESRVVEVAAAFAAGVGAISKGADRLVMQGWVERRSNPADRRSSLLCLTASGSVLVTAAEATFHQALEELITLSDVQVDESTATLLTLRRTLERARLGLPVG